MVTRQLLLFLVVGILRFSVGDIVVTLDGQLSGDERTSRSGRAYLAWTRIPYAKPPVGQLRLAAPLPVDKWLGVLNATEPAPFCPQSISIGQIRKNLNEDCLYLNIYKPKIDGNSLPVLFYVHGGAFISGFSGFRNSPDYLMDEDVILVTVAYRLGALGFMTLNDPALPGNFGLKDQALALHWVKNNIASFGGDPNSITTVGESAGGASSHFLLLSPLTSDLVKGAIAISGTVNKVWGLQSAEKIAETSRGMAQRMGCSAEIPSQIVECLRGVENIERFTDLAHLSNTVSPTLFLGPVVEPEGPGAFATADFWSIETQKPLLTSYSAGEYLLFEIPLLSFGLGKLKQYTKDFEGFARLYLNYTVPAERLAESAKKLKARYLTHKKLTAAAHDMSMMAQDSSFVYPALSVARAHKGPMWVYTLEHKGELGLAQLLPGGKNLLTKVPCHVDDLFLLFNERVLFKNPKPVQDPVDLEKSKELIRYFVNFARHGNPTPEGSPLIWKPFQGNEILRFRTEGSAMAEQDFVDVQNGVYNFWKDLNG